MTSGSGVLASRSSSPPLRCCEEHTLGPSPLELDSLNTSSYVYSERESCWSRASDSGAFQEHQKRRELFLHALPNRAPRRVHLCMASSAFSPTTTTGRTSPLSPYLPLDCPTPLIILPHLTRDAPRRIFGARRPSVRPPSCARRTRPHRLQAGGADDRRRPVRPVVVRRGPDGN